MKKQLCLFTIIFILFAYIRVLYANSYMTLGLDKSLMNTYLAEDESTNTEVKAVVDYFVNNFIRPEMSDFEKEIQIIRYLVETVTYDVDETHDDSQVIDDTYKAYGALVNHKAVCSGYAKAFDLLAKSCNLSTAIVTGDAVNSSMQEGPHAWNQIYLDGAWYNVDVTWEDPITNMQLGFNQLFNNYINRTDEEFSINHIRSNGHECTATKYGKNLVAYYLNTGIIDFNANLDTLRKMYEAQIQFYNVASQEEELKVIVDKLLLLGAKYDNNSNLLLNCSDADITNYILQHLNIGENVITIVTNPNTQNVFSIDSGNWLENNITINKRCTMNRIFSSDGKFDTRVLIFKFE